MKRALLLASSLLALSTVGYTEEIDASPEGEPPASTSVDDQPDNQIAETSPTLLLVVTNEECQQMDPLDI